MKRAVKPHAQTILARIKRDRKFAKALYAEAVNALLDGETAEGLSIWQLEPG